MNFKNLLASFIFCSIQLNGFAQINSKTEYQLVDSIFKKMEQLLESNGMFKEAVFLSETSFIPDSAENNQYKRFINGCFNIVQKISAASSYSGYKKNDSLNYIQNFSLFTFMAKGINIKFDSMEIQTTPFRYNFNDPQGNADWTSTFVTKLLATHQGNCRSLTYLYKILADELGAKCWLALAPNHIYIRNYSKQIGWYNTELTSGTFPTDAWIAATGYVSTDAIRSGVYMDTLSNQQSIALCVMDLAQGYIKQTNNYTDGFVLKCCNLVLHYHNINPEALLLKAETLKKIYFKETEEKSPDAQNTYNEMEQTYITLVKSGYRQMPFEVYQKWLKTVNSEKDRYLNKQLPGNK